MSDPARGGQPSAELVGRAPEIAALEAVVDGVRAPRIAFVRGEAGIGKTALVRYTINRAARAGRTIVQAAALEMERDRPFGAIVDAVGLDQRGRDERSVRVSGLLRDPAGSGLPAADVRYAVAEQLVDLIEEGSTPDGCVVAIEDLHWADPSTLLTLSRLVGRLPYSDISLVCTARPVPASDALAAFIDDVSDHGATLIELGPLRRADVASLVTTLIGREPGDKMLSSFDAAGGNPFLVCELVAALDAAEDGASDRNEIHVPATVRATVLNRFRFLGRRANELMSLASVLGGAFSLDDLCLVVGEPASDLLDVVRECVQAGVLRDADDRLAFRHDLVREALYEEMPGSVRRGLHAQAGRALAAAGRPPAQVATHFAAGASPGDREAVEWLRRAAEDASLTAPVIAVELLERALELATDRGTINELQAELAHHLVLLRRYDVSEKIARRLLSVDLPEHIARRNRLTLLQNLFLQGRVAEQMQLAHELADTTTDEVERARLMAELAWPLFLRGDASEAEEKAAAALTVGERYDDVTTIDTALTALSVIQIFSGRPSEGLVSAQRRIAIRERVRVTRELGSAVGGSHVHPLYVLMIAYFELDRAEESHAARREVVAELTRLGVPDPESESRGSDCLVLGRWDEAVTVARAGLNAHREHGFSRTIGTAIAVLAIVLTHRDEIDEARALLDEADAEIAAKGASRGVDFLMVRWARAVLLEATGDQVGAFQVYEPLFEALNVRNIVPPFRGLAADLARVAVAVGRPDLAARAVAELERIQSLEPGVASLRGAFLRARGLAEQDPDLLTAAVAEFRTSPRLPDHAYAAEEAGQMLATAGRRDEAVAYLQEAVEIYEQLEAPRLIARTEAALRSLGVKRGRTGARKRPQMGWDSLTEAEQRVVGFIADGLSNGRIAERLYISKRTVETHVSSIMRKLGASSRAELIAQAVRRPQVVTS
jgi:DNA-binding NarL/FixJ family response regulator